MSTMNISLADNLKTFVDQQVSERGYGTSSEYVRELIRRDRDREQLRGLIMDGGSSPPTEPIDEPLLRKPAGSHSKPLQGVTAKLVIPREQARKDVDTAVEAYLETAGPGLLSAWSSISNGPTPNLPVIRLPCGRVSLTNSASPISATFGSKAFLV